MCIFPVLKRRHSDGECSEIVKTINKSRSNYLQEKTLVVRKLKVKHIHTYALTQPAESVELISAVKYYKVFTTIK